MKYKIIKTKYGFRVLGRIRKITGHLWWKKIVNEWVSINNMGSKVLSGNSGTTYMPINSLYYPMTPFRTKEEAKEFIKQTKKKNKMVDKFEDYEKKRDAAERIIGSYQPVVDNTGLPPGGRTIREGKDKSNLKTVTSPRPKVKPAPQGKGDFKYLNSQEYINKKECEAKLYKGKRKPQPPKPPLSRCIIEGVGHFCIICGSTSQRIGFLGLCGERLCINEKCDNSKPKTK